MTPTTSTTALPEVFVSDDGRVVIAGVTHPELQLRRAKFDLVLWLLQNKKAIFGVIGSICGFIVTLSISVPELSVMFPVAMKVILAAATFITYALAHASSPDAKSIPAPPALAIARLGTNSLEPVK